MLWAKESNKNSALYVDILKLSGRSVNLTYKQLYSKPKPMPKKNDKVSVAKKERGNSIFKMRDWAYSMELYNESLCYAENGSKNICLIYANRSACFFHMKKYAECLVDIELATAAGYPEHLMPKLDKRKAECLKFIEEGAQSESGPKLSYDVDEKFPCMANVLKVERDENGEYSLVAKEDIDIGQTIAFEEAFTKFLYVRPGWKCNICMNRNTNLIPCKDCTGAMFCRNKCQGNFLHEYECGKIVSDDSHVNGINMKEIRLMLQAIHMFPNADELMEFVESVKKSDQKKLPERLTDDKSKYETYLKLKLGKEFEASEVWSAVVMKIFNFLMEFPKISKMFESKKHQRFLMHLIGEHSKVSNSNAICLNVPMRHGASKPFYCHMSLIVRYFNYSCSPNVANFDYDGDMLYITARPVKKGERLFMTYFWPLIPNKKERQQALWKQREEVCHCALCEGSIGTVTPEQKKRMKKDADYRHITYRYDTYTAEKNKGSEMALLVKCASFLKRFADVPWSEEIATVVNAYKFTSSTVIAGNNIPWHWVEFEKNPGDLFG